MTGVRRVLPHSLVVLAVLAGARPSVADDAVLTQRNDNQRTGAQLGETQLTPANVNAASFGRLYALDVSEPKVDDKPQVDATIAAQPLYVPNVNFNGVLRDVLYVATRTNKIYAFDVGTPHLQNRFLNKVLLIDPDPLRSGADAEPLPGMTEWFPAILGP
jgi:hypothetical protein